jgi:phosphatidylinositol alpha-mannosyltransferase
MRIAIVVPYDLAEEGGVKSHAFHLAAAMRRAGDQVEVIGPLSRGSAPPHVRGFGGVVNIRANGADNHMSLLASPWAVGRYVRERAFDVIHLHEPMVPPLSYYALWASTGAACVATFHMYAEKEPAPSRVARGVLAPVIFPLLHAGIAVSRAAADYAAVVWRRPLHVIPNGVPTDLFTPGTNGSPPKPGAPLRLLFVGNWRDTRKGLPILLDAYRRLLASGLAVSLDVIGEGSPGPDMSSLPGTTFHGAVAVEKLADHYRHCDIFVSPATGQESFGIVLLEAMASGRAVVCSDIRGYRDVANPEGFRLVPAGDAGALAAALETLARDPARRKAMGAANRARALAYDWSRLADRVRSVYREAVAERSLGRATAAARSPRATVQLDPPG